jgi:hypothetical protein
LEEQEDQEEDQVIIHHASTTSTTISDTRRALARELERPAVSAAEAGKGWIVCDQQQTQWRSARRRDFIAAYCLGSSKEAICRRGFIPSAAV